MKNILIFLGLLLSYSAFGQCPNSYSITANANSYPHCPGTPTGSLGMSQTTYYAAATYLWSTGATTRQISNITDGNYSVTVTDPTTCVYVDSFYLSPSPAGMQFNVRKDYCGNDYRPQLPNNVVYPVTYQWSNGSTQNKLSNPVPGQYGLTVTSGNGCVGTTTFTVTAQSYNPSANQFSYIATPATCGNNDGTVDITFAGVDSIGSYYQWSDGSRREDRTNLAAGVYYVRLSSSCFYSQWEKVIIPGPHVDYLVNSNSCGSINSGSIALTPSGISNPTYLWSTGATTATISGLLSGVYNVTVTGTNCTVTGSYTVDTGRYNILNVYLVTDTTGDCTNEAINTRTSGGSYSTFNADQNTYLWNTGATTARINISPSVAATYVVTVTDGSGCVAKDSVTVNQTGGTITGVVTDATCGNNDGAIDITASSQFSGFSWHPTGATTADINNIYAGFHVLTSYTSSGCSRIDSFAVGEFIIIESIDAGCGLGNGTITVRDYGMTNPVYTWSHGASTSHVTGLVAGDYYVTVTNGSCNIIDTITIQDQGYVQSGIQFDDPCVPTLATAIPSGGAAPFTYLWSTGDAGQFLTNITAGANYGVTITDANGCMHDTIMMAPNSPVINAAPTVTDATCGGKNGEVQLNVTGGTAPFSYNWSHVTANTPNMIGIYPGQYTAYITDNAGCTKVVDSINVGGQVNFIISAVVTQLNGTPLSGAIDVTVSNNAGVSYAWSNGATTQDLTGLNSGRYQVTITEPSGCTHTRLYDIVGNGGSRIYYIRGTVYDVTSTNTCTSSGALELSNRMVRLMPGNHIELTNSKGEYSFAVANPTTYTVELVPNLSLNTVHVCPATNTITTTASSYNNNFYVTNPPFQDLKINLFDVSNATPGFVYLNRIEYCNVGNTIQNGIVEYTYNPLLGFQSITGRGSLLTFHNIAGHTFNWTFSNLLPSECRWLEVDFRVPATTALGTNLAGTAVVSPTLGDAKPSDNTDGEATIVVGSYDPNDKQVDLYHTGNAWDGGEIYQNEEELEYTIRFQNTGTAPAQFVIIRDTLDANLIPTSIRNVSTRHDVEMRIEDGNVLVATFNNIYLPDSSADFKASMGFVKFDINRLPNLPIGTEIENTAAIYFDFNLPIITNTPVSTIGTITNTVNLDNSKLDMNVMPNPFGNQITLQYTLEQQEKVTIEIQNALGQVVKRYTSGQTQQAGAYIEQVSTTELPSAMYLLVLRTENQIVTKRIVKK